MKPSSLLFFIVSSSIAHLSTCSDENTYSFDIINKNSWYSIAKKIFQGRTPCNFTVIPSSYVNNSDAVDGSGDSVLLIRKKLKDTEQVNSKNSDSNSDTSGVSSHSDNKSCCNKGKKLEEEEELNFNKKYEGKEYEQFRKNLSFIESSLHNEPTSETNSKMDNSYTGSLNHEEKNDFSIPDEYKPQNISDILIGASEEDRTYELKGDEPCDANMTLGEIINRTNEQTVNYTIDVNKILCVHLESIGGNGYLWALLGVYKQKPIINPEQFPKKKITKSFFSNEISVTQPKSVEKKKTDNPNSSSLNSQQGSGNPHIIKPLGGLVGGSSMLQSKVKAHKPGTYYIVYAYYRPFDPTVHANTKILQLTVS
ncbi:inhibitor of cysteine proteases [Plasmodium gonderi]|uniref:Inhibitor of cysteine proteases n=1 Tax=Plasmodium gonderi TaxID=77519 RepID=A0A1Y1JJC7_PLAGO|nr:inhibitor of cysteine proteases [Plasmodium gonderi]GAW80184.1 inhibitor of cysteine proteases [Plasmodium gonderi]